MLSPRESRERLAQEISQSGGMTAQEVFDFAKNNKLWFGPIGMIVVLVRQIRHGHIAFDAKTEKFTAPPQAK